MIRSIAALVEVPLALLKRSTISWEMGESVMVVLREEASWRRAFIVLPRRDASLLDSADGVLALIHLP